MTSTSWLGRQVVLLAKECVLDLCVPTVCTNSCGVTVCFRRFPFIGHLSTPTYTARFYIMSIHVSACLDGSHGKLRFALDLGVILLTGVFIGVVLTSRFNMGCHCHCGLASSTRAPCSPGLCAPLELTDIPRPPQLQAAGPLAPETPGLPWCVLNPVGEVKSALRGLALLGQGAGDKWGLGHGCRGMGHGMDGVLRGPSLLPLFPQM